MRDEPSTPLNIYNPALLRIFFPISTGTDSKRDLSPPPPPPPCFVNPPFKRIALSRRFTGFQYSPINPAAPLDQLMKNKGQAEEEGEGEHRERERERERERRKERKKENGRKKQEKESRLFGARGAWYTRRKPQKRPFRQV